MTYIDKKGSKVKPSGYGKFDHLICRFDELPFVVIVAKQKVSSEYTPKGRRQ